MNSIKLKVEHDYEEAFVEGLLEILDRKAQDNANLKEQRPSIPKVDLRGIRKKLGVSQQEFCALYGIPLATLRNWEQGRTEPDVASCLLLHLISKFPKEIASQVEELDK